MRRKVFIALLALCSTNVLSCNVIAEYAIETSDNVHKLNYRQNMNLDKPEELFDAIIDSVSVIHSRSISRDRENDDILYFLSCSLTKENKIRGFASVLNYYDVDSILHIKNTYGRYSFGSPRLNCKTLIDLQENLSNICDDIKVDYTHMRIASPFSEHIS